MLLIEDIFVPSTVTGLRVRFDEIDFRRKGDAIFLRVVGPQECYESHAIVSANRSQLGAAAEAGLLLVRLLEGD